MFREAIPELSQAAFVIAPDFRLLGTYPLRNKFYWCPVAPTFQMPSQPEWSGRGGDRSFAAANHPDFHLKPADNRGLSQ
jgi:hypothetical protein